MQTRSQYPQHGYNEDDNPNRNKAHKIIFWWILFLGAVLVWNAFGNSKSGTQITKITYTKFVNLIKEGKIQAVVIMENDISGIIKVTDQSLLPFKTKLPDGADIIPLLIEKNVDIEAEERSTSIWIILITWMPALLLMALFIFMMKSAGNMPNKLMSFGRSTARPSVSTTTFKHVAGVDEAKQELEEVVQFLKDPLKVARLGGKIPKGVLLIGRPGTGKTLLARAVAGEAGVPFFSISGSNFVEMFVGVGASRVRSLFEEAKKFPPCIIFIDEIDAVGRSRGTGLGGGHDEREQTLNQLLVEMDGFESNRGIIVIAATNRPDVLDPALLRPGRFDRQVTVSLPDINGRLAILKVHTANIPLSPDTDLMTVARGTPGFSGADLANLANEAAIDASQKSQESILVENFNTARDKILMGKERRTLAMSPEEKRNTAYHEAGHTLVTMALPGTDPIHKVSIIPRGQALGVTQQLPESDRYNLSKEFLLNQLAILMGGRAAEEIFLNVATTGAENDILQATNSARSMVCRWGMSEKIGPVALSGREEHIFLGKEFAKKDETSEATAAQIDTEIKGILTQAMQAAKEILQANSTALSALANALLERETLDLAQISQIINPQSLVRPSGIVQPGTASENH